MNGRFMTTMLLLVAASAAFAPGASAQQDLAIPSAGEIQAAAVGMVGVEPGPNQFGTNWSWTVIPVTAWDPYSSSSTYTASDFFYRYSNVAGLYLASLDLPPGTEIQQVCLYVWDGSSISDIYFDWTIQSLGDLTEDATVTFVSSAQTSKAATPGYTTICATRWEPRSRRRLLRR